MKTKRLTTHLAVANNSRKACGDPNGGPATVALERVNCKTCLRVARCDEAIAAIAKLIFLAGDPDENGAELTLLAYKIAQSLELNRDEKAQLEERAQLSEIDLQCALGRTFRLAFGRKTP